MDEALVAQQTFKVLHRVDTGVAKLTSGMDMLINGNLLYVAGGAGLAVFDVSRPEVPQRIFKETSTQ